MELLTKLKFPLSVILGLLVITGGGQLYQVWAEVPSDSDYLLITNAPNLKLTPGEIREVSLIIQNTGNGLWWEGNSLRLGTVFSNGIADRPSIWSTDSWLSNMRVAPIGLENKSVRPRQMATFKFTIKTPTKIGLYKEYFQPLLEGSHWLTGTPIGLTLQVGEMNEVTIQEAQPKLIRINRTTQTGEWIENGFVVATLPVSTGKSGYTTPAGKYTIFNHIENAYSQEYELWMPNWIGLKSVTRGIQGYGIHGLPYWKVRASKFEEGKIYPGGRLYTAGRLYEGYSHLGMAMSHGCIRFGVGESAALFAWAENGTPVLVV